MRKKQNEKNYAVWCCVCRLLCVFQVVMCKIILGKHTDQTFIIHILPNQACEQNTNSNICGSFSLLNFVFLLSFHEFKAFSCIVCLLFSLGANEKNIHQKRNTRKGYSATNNDKFFTLSILVNLSSCIHINVHHNPFEILYRLSTFSFNASSLDLRTKREPKIDH